MAVQIYQRFFEMTRGLWIKIISNSHLNKSFTKDVLWTMPPIQNVLSRNNANNDYSWFSSSSPCNTLLFIYSRAGEVCLIAFPHYNNSAVTCGSTWFFQILTLSPDPVRLGFFFAFDCMQRIVDGRALLPAPRSCERIVYHASDSLHTETNWNTVRQKGGKSK